VTCKQCGRPVNDEELLTLSIRSGPPIRETGQVAGWTTYDLGYFHDECWEDFQREHGLLGVL
jgi:hypothetical protein